MSQDKLEGKAHCSYVCSKMDNQIYAVGTEYITENGNTRTSVNGCTEISVVIREGCAFSCISGSLFTQLHEKVGLKMYSVELDSFMYKNKVINVLGETFILMQLRDVAFWWRVLIVKVEVARGVELYPMVVLGRDFCKDCCVEIKRTGRNSVLYDMAYKIPYNKISTCGCITPECVCRLPRLECVSTPYTHTEEQETWD